MKTLIIASALCLGLVGCSGKESEKIAAMQKKDKNLTCREIMLEQNEAEFYRSTAEKNKEPGVGSLLMPLGYISTYMSAEDAVGAAAARVDYLSRVYDIMDCDNKLEMAAKKNKLMSRQIAATMDNDTENAIATPAMQQMSQPMPAIPQGYMIVPAQPQQQSLYHPMSYQPPQYYTNPIDVREDEDSGYVLREAYGPTF